METGAVLIGQQVETLTHLSTKPRAVNLMNLAQINSTVPVESMTVIVLILLGAAVKAIRHLSKRLSLSQLTLETESLTLNLQTQQHLLQQESQQQEQQGSDENGRCNDDDGGIPQFIERPKW